MVSSTLPLGYRGGGLSGYENIITSTPRKIALKNSKYPLVINLYSLFKALLNVVSLLISLDQSLLCTTCIPIISNIFKLLVHRHTIHQNNNNMKYIRNIFSIRCPTQQESFKTWSRINGKNNKRWTTGLRLSYVEIKHLYEK